ncbi:crossover junction endonuclease EME1 [Bacillus rossius redtenbacheri]|uniref:crossover junction endonuclease EME1 n=1 Tax=Bacillus rossius redtenbacheri TaxID=93214 RepID=UPI002FDE4331
MEGGVIELSSDSSAPASPSAPAAEGLPSVAEVEQGLGLGQPPRHAHTVSDSDESVVAVEYEERTVCGDKDRQGVSSTAKKRPRFQCSNMAARRQLREEDKRERQRQRERRRAEQQLARAVKAAAAEQLRATKPGECVKYVEVQLDSSLLTDPYGGQLLLALQGADYRFSVQPAAVPRSVSWTRLVPGDSARLEAEVLVVRPWPELEQLVASGQLCAHARSLRADLPGRSVTLVVYGSDQYFRLQKTRRNQQLRGRVRGSEQGAGALEGPGVSRERLEEALAEVQLATGCCHRLVESPAALGALVAQFSKAVAERPYKLERQRKEQQQCDWFALADSKDCVRVDGEGNGLLRLWKQQLCQFNLATLETAEAVASKYQSPRALLQAYGRCESQRSAELLLQDLPIRRALGPLTSTRRVGPELSRKVHRFFTAGDADSLLAPE